MNKLDYYIRSYYKILPSVSTKNFYSGFSLLLNKVKNEFIFRLYSSASDLHVPIIMNLKEPIYFQLLNRESLDKKEIERLIEAYNLIIISGKELIERIIYKHNKLSYIEEIIKEYEALFQFLDLEPNIDSEIDKLREIQQDNLISIACRVLHFICKRNVSIDYIHIPIKLFDHVNLINLDIYTESYDEFLEESYKVITPKYSRVYFLSFMLIYLMITEKIETTQRLINKIKIDRESFYRVGPIEDLERTIESNSFNELAFYGYSSELVKNAKQDLEEIIVNSKENIRTQTIEELKTCKWNNEIEINYKELFIEECNDSLFRIIL